MVGGDKVSIKKRTSLSPGDLVLSGRYEILKVIHTSGMANVYLVSDKSLKKQWCLKEIVKSEAGRNKIEYRSLLQEANIMKSLNHSGIPRIVSIEEEGDSIFIVMDYVEGLSVKEWLNKKGSIKQSVVVSWMKQVCNILIYLHNKKEPIFYRDMKPDNIMIQDDGNIKVLDFGISVVISENNKIIKEALGTKGYAAPEQKKKGLPYDLRSDIYALGMTMYHMLTGINPGIVEKGNLKPIREINSGLSVGLEVIIDKCTKENPDERYQTVEEVLYALINFTKLDEKYIKGLKRKVSISVGLFLSSILLISFSFIPFGMYKSQEKDLYDNKLEVAVQTGRSEDYLEAISLNPTNLAPYVGLIDSFKVDGVFSKDEESGLLGLINPILSDIKSDADYGSLSYNIGKLYWFYYEGNDGDVVSSKWFKEAIDSNFNKKDAKVYYDLGNFKRTVSMAIVESSDSGMYLEYWNNLMSAKAIDSGEIIELQLYNAIADAIQSYSYRLMTDGVKKEDVVKEITGIQNYLAVLNPVSDKSKELYSSLKHKTSSLMSIVDAAYSQGGVD